MLGVTDKILATIEAIKESDIDGCITGSCLCGKNMDDWQDIPDVDIFCYGEKEMIHAIDYVNYKMGFKFGAYDNENSEKQEYTKFGWIRDGKRNKYDSLLDTVKLIKDGIVVNISCRKYQNDVISVISNFDMSIIMCGYDIKTGNFYDQRKSFAHGSKDIADPNIFRKHGADDWVTKRWIRQWDRVIKYDDRGFDTRPMAEFYLQLIDAVINKGSLWTSEAAIANHQETLDELLPMREKIQTWLNDKAEEEE